MADYMSEARYRATQEVAAALIEAAGKTLQLHGGRDPKGPQIIAAGFAMALRRIGKHIDAEIPKTVRRLLDEFP